jgi:hypothetical protein
LALRKARLRPGLRQRRPQGGVFGGMDRFRH